MATTVESLEQSPGVKVLHVNQDVVVVYSGGAFLRNLPYLMDEYTTLVVRNIGWSPRYSRKLANKGLGVDYLTKGAPLNDQTIDFILEDPKKARMVPSLELFRKEDGIPGRYDGMSAERMYYPMVRKAEHQPKIEVPVLFHVIRVNEEKERGHGRGRFSVELALILHRVAEWYQHRTGSHVAAYTNTQSPALDQELSFPWKHSFSENPFAYEIEKEMYAIVGGYGSGVDENGVSRGDYLEQNIAIQVRPEHEDSMRIYRIMFDDYKMGPLDAIYPLYKVA